MVESESPIDADHSVRLATAYLDALQCKNLEAILALLSDDFELIVPFCASGDNEETAADSRSRRNLREAAANFERAFGQMATVRFPERQISPALNPHVVFVEAVGDIRMSDGRPYRNRYVFRFDLMDGKIRRVREYLNPVTSALAFGRPIPANAGA